MKTTESTATDLEQVLQGCLMKNISSQKSLYTWCYARLRHVCKRYGIMDHDIDIVLNEAMFKVFVHIARFTYQPLKLESALFAWMKKVLIHTCIDHLRAKFDNYETLSSRTEEASVQYPANSNIDFEKMIQLIHKLLPAQTAAVFNLYVFDHYKHREIAELLNISENTSKWRFAEAKHILEQHISFLLQS